MHCLRRKRSGFAYTKKQAASYAVLTYDLTTGHLQSGSTADNEAGVATDPNHFWMVVEQYESLRIANSNLLINRLPQLETVLRKLPR